MCACVRQNSTINDAAEGQFSFCMLSIAGMEYKRFRLSAPMGWKPGIHVHSTGPCLPFPSPCLNVSVTSMALTGTTDLLWCLQAQTSRPSVPPHEHISPIPILPPTKNPLR